MEPKSPGGYTLRRYRMLFMANSKYSMMMDGSVVPLLRLNDFVSLDVAIIFAEQGMLMNEC